VTRLAIVVAGKQAARRRRALSAATFLLATPALAREFCPDRPDRANPPCVTDVGRFEVETSLADWSLTRAPHARMDSILVGDLLLRTGLTRSVEARVGLTSYGFTRTRAGSDIAREEGAGDLSLGLRWNLARPDGNGLSVALQPTLTLPTGGTAIGAGTWAFALALPASVDLGHGFALGFTPEVDAAANGDRRGRHLAYSGALVLGHPLTRALAASAELYAARDESPDRADRASADFSLALRIAPDTQLDASSYVGLTPDTPDVEWIVGLAHRF